MIDSLKTLAQQAGERILSFYGQPIPVEKKSDDSPLTKADLASPLDSRWLAFTGCKHPCPFGGIQPDGSISTAILGNTLGG